MTRNWMVAAIAALVILFWAIAIRAADCPSGACPPSIRGSVGTFGRAWVEPDGSTVLRGGLGGASVEINQPAPTIVPVYFGGHSMPGAGVYVGVIRGKGVTLTCWHIAQDGIQRVGLAPCVSIYRDNHGYDLAAVVTEPLDIPVVRIGDYARQGTTVTICGRPLGRVLRRVARVVGYVVPGHGQHYGDLKLDVAVQPGDSGGAVFNGNGQLVGLVWGTASDGSGSSVAVPAPAIRDFLDRLKSTMAEEDAEAESPPLPGPATEPSPKEKPATKQYDELRELIQANAMAIAALAERAPMQGPGGPKGEPGKFDLTDEEVLRLVARFPPIRLETIKGEAGDETRIAKIRNAKPGEVIDVSIGHLGGALRLQLVPVKSEGAK